MAGTRHFTRRRGILLRVQECAPVSTADMAGFAARLSALEGQYAHEEQRLALTKHLERLVK